MMPWFGSYGQAGKAGQQIMALAWRHQNRPVLPVQSRSFSAKKRQRCHNTLRKDSEPPHSQPGSC